MREFLEKVNPKHKKYFSTLRAALLELPETQESVEIDDMEGEWCPAYRVRGSDLVWVHFDERLGLASRSNLTSRRRLHRMRTWTA